MPTLVRLLASVLLLAAVLTGQGLPPLIDRELLFGNPEIAGAQISPDGTYISFLKPWKDTRNIWVKKTEEPFSAARLLTTETKRPIPAYFWSRDAKRILFVKDADGDENFNVYAVDPAASPAAGSEAPASKDLTGLKGVRVYIYAVPKSQPDVVYIGLNDRDKAWHDLYKLTLSTGERTLVRKNEERIAGWNFDLSGQLRLASRVANSGDQETLRVDASGFTKIYSCDLFESCGVVRFHKDGKRVYLETDKGSDRNLSTLELMDAETGKTEIVESDPQKRVDFGNTTFSEKSDELIATSYIDDKRRIYFRSKPDEADYNWLKKQKPGMEVNLGSRTVDERLVLVTFNSDTEPGSTYLFDRQKKKLTLQYKIREKIQRESLSPMTAIRYKSSDGLEIPAYLTLPKGLPSKNLPLMVVPHGGPWGRDFWGFNSMAQFLANRGYAVLMPNFRASTGFGKKFLNAGNGEWGRKMQDDVTWGVKYLIDQGTADPNASGSWAVRMAVKDGGATWQVTDSMQTPMGEAIDMTTLDKQSLVVLKRAVKQGPMAIDVSFDGGKASGTMGMNGQNRPIAADAGGPLYADAAGAQQAIAALPLAEGYTTIIRNFDLQKQKPRLMQVAVAGSEKVTVPGGTFDAFKVEMTSAEGGPDKATLWIDKPSRKPVRMAIATGGGTLTAELAE